MKTKSLVLLSGGLDSRLACKILQEQSQVEAVFFILPFAGGCCSDKFCVFKFCQKHGIKLHIIDCTANPLFDEYLSIIRNPEYSRGKALNPCIDCHLFMLRKAKALALSLGIEIIATGEVLGERPLSQTKKALNLIDKNLDFEVLRPLSAGLLNPTNYEKSRLISREKLLAIKGRKRNNQLELAKKYKIDFPQPAGGCLLCEPNYCKKLKPVLDNLTYEKIKLLNIGRHFPGIILGRNKMENELLEKQAGIKIIPQDNPGPTALVKDEKLVEKAKILIQKYSKKQINEFKIIS